MVDMLPVYPLAWLYNLVVRNKKRVDVVILNKKLLGSFYYVVEFMLEVLLTSVGI